MKLQIAGMLLTAATGFAIAPTGSACTNAAVFCRNIGISGTPSIDLTVAAASAASLSELLTVSKDGSLRYWNSWGRLFETALGFHEHGSSAHFDEGALANSALQIEMLGTLHARLAGARAFARAESRQANWSQAQIDLALESAASKGRVEAISADVDVASFSLDALRSDGVVDESWEHDSARPLKDTAPDSTVGLRPANRRRARALDPRGSASSPRFSTNDTRSHA